MAEKKNYHKSGKVGTKNKNKKIYWTVSMEQAVTNT